LISISRLLEKKPACRDTPILWITNREEQNTFSRRNFTITLILQPLSLRFSPTFREHLVSMWWWLDRALCVKLGALVWNCGYLFGYSGR
jgi:hypothetical protein